LHNRQHALKKIALICLPGNIFSYFSFFAPRELRSYSRQLLLARNRYRLSHYFAENFYSEKSELKPESESAFAARLFRRKKLLAENGTFKIRFQAFGN
jgi:hypothetical protein